MAIEANENECFICRTKNRLLRETQLQCYTICAGCRNDVVSFVIDLATIHRKYGADGVLNFRRQVNSYFLGFNNVLTEGVG